MALVHVDDTVRLFGVEPDDCALSYFQRPQSRTTSGVWRRQMRCPNLGREAVLGERSFDARNKISAIGFVVRVLQLAAAAFREMTAGRLLMMRPRSKRSVV